MDWNRVGVLRRLFGGGDWELPVAEDGRDPGVQAQYRKALHQSRHASLWDAPLNEIRYVVVDTETTGFIPQTDCLLSLAAVEIQGDRVTGRYYNSYTAIPAGAIIPQVVTDLTGIRAQDLEDAPHPTEVVEKFLQFLNGDVLVAHYARHDVAFINAQLRKDGLDELENRVLDTANLFQWIHGLPQVPPLETLIAHYKIPLETRHTALGDAGMTARIWQKMMADIQKKGILTLGDLLEGMILKRK